MNLISMATDVLTEFIDPGDRKWLQALGRAPHDFYHLPEYVAFSSKYEGGTPKAFYAEANGSLLLVPLLIRGIPAALQAPAQWCDATSPYGYPGPITAPNDGLFLRPFLCALRETMANLGLITAFVRLHPLLSIGEEVLSEFGVLMKHNPTVYIDLGPPIEEIEKRIRGNHKRDIRKLARTGFTLSVDDWSRVTEFVQIYQKAMTRLSADPFYHFSSQYFEDLRCALGTRLHLCAVLAPNGEMAAGGIFTCVNGIAQYHLGGTRQEYLPDAPSKLMFYHMIRWTKDAGGRILHLGGGVGGHSDSLFHFKAGFSDLRSYFYTYRMVLDCEKYSILNKNWQTKYEYLGIDHSDFFPGYRRL